MSNSDSYFQGLFRGSVVEMSSEAKFGLSGTQVWPTMFFHRLWHLHHEQSEQILTFLRHLKTKQESRIASGVAVGAKSSQGLYEGNFDLFLESDESLQKLVSFIRATLASAVSIANENETPASNISVRFMDSWYHVTNDSGFHDAHFHHGCSWCGIYYLRLGASGVREGASAPNGGSRFYSPIGLGGGYRDYGNKYQSATIDVPLTEGMLLLFPSYLMHSGLPYRGAEDRVVIAFNAQAHLIVS